MADNGGTRLSLHHHTTASFSERLNILAYVTTSFYLLQNLVSQPHSQEALFQFFGPANSRPPQAAVPGEREETLRIPNTPQVLLGFPHEFPPLLSGFLCRTGSNPALPRIDPSAHCKELLAWLCPLSLTSILLPYPVSVVLYFLYALVFARKAFWSRVVAQKRNRGAMVPL